MLDKTITRKSETVHKAQMTVYEAIDNELNRVHTLMNKLLYSGQDQGDNVQEMWKRIKEMQETLIECAKKGASEDLVQKVADLQKYAAERILTQGE